MLFIVPTPIGNLKDITLRAIEVLQDVEVILAEDTRTTGRLLKHYEIKTPMRSFHIHNEHRSLSSLIDQLKGGVKMALVSDAGTPGVSDPGFLLSREARLNDVEVQCLPGATALIPALVNSGLPSDKFYFEGFLPHKKGRQTRLKYLATMDHTFIIYESPHRAAKAIDQLIEFCGVERAASLSREISKLHEENIKGSLGEIKLALEAKQQIKGEIVIVIAGKSD